MASLGVEISHRGVRLAAIVAVLLGSIPASVATAQATPVPGAPLNPSAGGLDSQAIVSWDRPTGDSTIDRYDVTFTAGTATQSTAVTDLKTACTSDRVVCGLKVSGLANSTRYNVSITAHNSSGSGPAATTNVAPKPQAQIGYTYQTSSGYTAADWVIGLSPGSKGLAFSPSGDLYFVSDSDRRLYRFPPAGGVASPATQVNATPFPFDWGRLLGMAFGRTGQLYVGRYDKGDIIELNPATGEMVRVVATGISYAVRGLAVDPLSGDLFASSGDGSVGTVRISNYLNGPGTVTTYRNVDAQVSGIAFGPDGTLYAVSDYFTSKPDNKITVGTTLSRISGTNKPAPPTASAIAVVTNAYGIALGVDPTDPTRVPFIMADREDGKITRVDLTTTPATTTDVMTGGTQGDFITLGPDGCFYATQFGPIVKLSASGSSCSFPQINLPPPVAIPPTATTAPIATPTVAPVAPPVSGGTTTACATPQPGPGSSAGSGTTTGSSTTGTPNPWDVGVGQGCFEKWIAESMAKANAFNGSADYNTNKPYSINKYGLLEGTYFHSVFAPSDFPKYNDNKYWWMWDYWNSPGNLSEFSGTGVENIRTYVLRCMGTSSTSGPFTSPSTGSIVPGASTSIPLFGSPQPTTAAGMAVQAAQVRIVAGGLGLLPVWLINGSNVANINLNLTFDPSVATPEGASQKGDLLGNAIFSVNASAPGVIRAGFAANTGISGTGTVMEMPFRAVGKPGDRTCVGVTVTTINDLGGTVLTIDRVPGEIVILNPDGTLPVGPDSTGQAGNPSVPGIPAGDCDGDGVLTELDALCALEMSVGLQPVRLIVDVDKSGDVTSRDAVIVLQRAIGKS